MAKKYTLEFESDMPQDFIKHLNNLGNAGEFSALMFPVAVKVLSIAEAVKNTSPKTYLAAGSTPKSSGKNLTQLTVAELKLVKPGTLIYLSNTPTTSPTSAWEVTPGQALLALGVPGMKTSMDHIGGALIYSPLPKKDIPTIEVKNIADFIPFPKGAAFEDNEGDVWVKQADDDIENWTLYTDGFNDTEPDEDFTLSPDEFEDYAPFKAVLDVPPAEVSGLKGVEPKEVIMDEVSATFSPEAFSKAISDIQIESVDKSDISIETIQALPKGHVLVDHSGDSWYSHGNGVMSVFKPTNGTTTISETIFSNYEPWTLTTKKWSEK